MCNKEARYDKNGHLTPMPMAMGRWSTSPFMGFWLGMCENHEEDVRGITCRDKLTILDPRQSVILLRVTPTAVQYLARGGEKKLFVPHGLWNLASAQRRRTRSAKRRILFKSPPFVLWENMRRLRMPYREHVSGNLYDSYQPRPQYRLTEYICTILRSIYTYTYIYMHGLFAMYVQRTMEWARPGTVQSHIPRVNVSTTLIFWYIYMYVCQYITTWLDLSLRRFIREVAPN